MAILCVALLVRGPVHAEESTSTLRAVGEALEKGSTGQSAGYGVLADAVERAISYIEELERQRSTLKEQVRTLTASVEEISRERDDATASGGRMLIKIREQEQKIAALTRELDGAREDAEAARATGEKASKVAADRIEEQQRELEALRAELARSAEAAEEEAKRKADEIAALDGKRAEALAAARKANDRIAELDATISRLQAELEEVSTKLSESELEVTVRQKQVEDLGTRLAEALRSKVEELERYRSEFFGRLRSMLEGRQGVRISGDRFIFQSEVLFRSGAATLGENGRRQLAEIAGVLLDITPEIPESIDWILQVEGHTDDVPIVNAPFASNWELSTARALSVVHELISLGLPPEHLAATGYGEFQPVEEGDDEIARHRNRRIELKLTQR